jgi:VWFA-related protein
MPMGYLIMKNTLKITTFILLLAWAAAAQDDTIRVATNLVTLNVSVADRKGKAVRGLSMRDFKLTDQGKGQEIESFSDAGAPVSFGIVYDMHPTTDVQMSSVLNGLRDFGKKFGPQDDMFVTVFNERGSLTTDFVPTEDQIRRQADTGAKSLYDAIFAASTKMSSARNHKRVLLVLTDGADRNSEHSLKQLKAHLRSVNVPVYGITFSTRNDRRQFSYSDMMANGRREMIRYDLADDLDRGAIADLAKASGGHTYDGNMRNRVYLAALAVQVSDEIKSQYVLGFYPDQLDGRQHKLKVTVAGQVPKRLKVAHRKSYQSPKG